MIPTLSIRYYNGNGTNLLCCFVRHCRAVVFLKRNPVFELNTPVGLISVVCRSCCCCCYCCWDGISSVLFTFSSELKYYALSHSNREPEPIRIKYPKMCSPYSSRAIVLFERRRKKNVAYSRLFSSFSSHSESNKNSRTKQTN